MERKPAKKLELVVAVLCCVLLFGLFVTRSIVTKNHLDLPRFRVGLVKQVLASLGSVSVVPSGAVARTLRG